jgi:hypothetical protein
MAVIVDDPLRREGLLAHDEAWRAVGAQSGDGADHPGAIDIYLRRADRPRSGGGDSAGGGAARKQQTAGRDHTAGNRSSAGEAMDLRLMQGGVVNGRHLLAPFRSPDHP